MRSFGPDDGGLRALSHLSSQITIPLSINRQGSLQHTNSKNSARIIALGRLISRSVILVHLPVILWLRTVGRETRIKRDEFLRLLRTDMCVRMPVDLVPDFSVRGRL